MGIMLKRFFKKLIVGTLREEFDGLHDAVLRLDLENVKQYVALSRQMQDFEKALQARLDSIEKKQRDLNEAELSWAQRYDSSVQYLQEQSSGYLKRALDAESKSPEEVRKTDSPYPMQIDIRVPKKVRP